MVKTYLKTFGRMFKRHVTRLVSIFLMVLISIGFSAGIGMSTDKLVYAFDKVYCESNMSDFQLRGESNLSSHIEKLEAEGFEVVKGGILEFCGTSLEMGDYTVNFEGTGEGYSRVYFFASHDDFLKQNTPEILETYQGEIGEGYIPIAVERATSQLREYALGETLSASLEVMRQSISFDFIVTEIVCNPLHLATQNDPTMTEIEGQEDEYEKLESIFYIPQLEFALKIMGREIMQSFPANNLYLSVPVLKERDTVIKHTLFGSEYEKSLKEETAKIEQIFAEETSEYAILTLHENYTFESCFSFADKVGIIGYVLMVVFLLVTLLVVLSTMTRLLDEERAQLACLSTLGYSPMKIVMKYLLFALVGTVIGATGGYFASIGLAYIIYINFSWIYTMPPFPAHISLSFYMIVTSIIVVATLLATLFSGLRKTHAHPAKLLRPKAPKAGKKVLLERIPFLWNRISFKYKSTLRNVFRFKMRFFMTVVAVMASTALVLAGLAVLDCCLFQSIGTEALIAVSVVVLVFAALLNAVVIYTLTNINISERNRELATLMVLGYHDSEVSMYVYREIYITSTVGILLGLPFGALLCGFIFNLMALGSLSAIGWYMWLIAPLLSLFFTFLVTLLLRRKIVKIDMNESLKAIE